MRDIEISLQHCASFEGNIHEAYQLAMQYLAQEGVEEAKENSELLLLFVLQMDRGRLLLNWNEPFPLEKRAGWCDMLRRKAKGEPIQYITGEAWFYGRRFVVDTAVLIPRPETELLVEAVLNAIDRVWENNEISPVVLDVGTGSGAISVTLQAEMPRLQVIASDISEEALQVAKRNASLLQVDKSMRFVQGDLLQPFLQANQLKYNEAVIDVLVSNPPYIPLRDMEGLQREVKDYEPHLALVGGEDGLNPYREMLKCLDELEQKPTIVAFELGIHQPAVIAALMQKMNYWNDIQIITDYNGIERHILAIKNR